MSRKGKNMRIDRRGFLAIRVLLLSLLLISTVKGDDQENTFKWFVFSATPPQSAAASDGSKIQVTGTGTFQVGDPERVTGGGTWATFGSSGSLTGSGNFQVTRLVKFDLAPGSVPGQHIPCGPRVLSHHLRRWESGRARCGLSSAWLASPSARGVQCVQGLRKLLEWFQRSDAFRCCHGGLNKSDNFRSQGEPPRGAWHQAGPNHVGPMRADRPALQPVSEELLRKEEKPRDRESDHRASS